MKQKLDGTLSIEAGVLGGSLAFAIDGQVHSFSGDPSAPAKAELLLPKIDELLQNSGASPKDIEKIVVSAGPGSFTGIRVGIATALGLANSLGIKVRQLPLLPALALAAKGVVCVSVPHGRGSTASQIFEVSAHAIDSIQPAFVHPSTASLDVINAEVAIDHFVAAKGSEPSFVDNPIVIANLAEQLLRAADDPRITEAQPIFLSKPVNA